MEIKSCEEYILAELNGLRVENRALKDALSDINDFLVALGVMSECVTETIQKMCDILDEDDDE